MGVPRHRPCQSARDSRPTVVVRLEDDGVVDGAARRGQRSNLPATTSRFEIVVRLVGQVVPYGAPSSVIPPFAVRTCPAEMARQAAAHGERPCPPRCRRQDLRLTRRTRRTTLDASALDEQGVDVGRPVRANLGFRHGSSYDEHIPAARGKHPTLQRIMAELGQLLATHREQQQRVGRRPDDQGVRVRPSSCGAGGATINCPALGGAAGLLPDMVVVVVVVVRSQRRSNWVLTLPMKIALWRRKEGLLATSSSH